MFLHDIPVPHLTTASMGEPCPVERILLSKLSLIESWFRKKWHETPPPLTSSVDLRHAGFKLAPVDTNLFPAGFNNLNPDFLPLCVQAAQSTLYEYSPSCQNLLLLPENHTRNRFYAKSLEVLREILIHAGFNVRIGNLDESATAPVKIEISDTKHLLMESLIRKEDKILLEDFVPCLIVLNNDLSSGIPSILHDIRQRIMPPISLGWSSRQKSVHFKYYADIAEEFGTLIGLDPWFINPLFRAVSPVDFMTLEGVDVVAREVDALLLLIKEKYKKYGISDPPFVIVKSDSGTYGMNVMTVHDGQQFLELNRKQRTKMATGKGSRKVDSVLIQEGVYSYETMEDGAVCEPVVYMIGPYVVGGFYRVHRDRSHNENLNAPGMHFEPLAFAEPCNMPRGDLGPEEYVNRFYAAGVIARLAALAAAREMIDVGGKA